MRRNLQLNVRKLGFVFSTIALFAAQTCQASDVVKIHPEARLQTWMAWGTSLCWWAHIVGGYPMKVRKEVCTRVFKDLGITLVRYNIGGGDDPAHTHIEKRAAIPAYLDSKGKWDWNADAAQRWVLSESVRQGAKHLEAFSNSPPYWMTESGCAAGGENGANNLPIARSKEFAEYLAEVVRHFHDQWHVTFETLEPLNEPSSNWWKSGGRQEGCRIDAGPRQSELLIATRDALASRGLKTKVSASDENSNSQAVTAWRELSPDAKAAVSQINTHSYYGNSQQTLHDLAMRDSKILTVSEYGDGDASGMTMARQIVRDLRVAQPSAWTYWQAVDQRHSGWGLLGMDLNGGDTTYEVNRKYWVFANFSKFIRPGWQFIGIDDSSSVAATHRGQLVLVTVNGRQARQVDYDLSSLGSRARMARAFRTSESESLAEVPLKPIHDGTLTVELPPRSVTTLVIEK